MKELKTSSLSTRVTPMVKREFNQKAEQYGEPSEILRELIMAFIENRLTMQPPNNHPLYEDNTK